jgi:hypothetical protein
MTPVNRTARKPQNGPEDSDSGTTSTLLRHVQLNNDNFVIDEQTLDNHENFRRLSIGSTNPFLDDEPGSEEVELEDAHEDPVTLEDLDVPKDEMRRYQKKDSDPDRSDLIEESKESSENNEIDDEESSLPRKKTNIEKYMKSKQREEQIKNYNESMIKETREQRALQRARVRQRESNSDDEIETNSLDSSPSKKVRFKLQ